jgi:hypothetical protein
MIICPGTFWLLELIVANGWRMDPPMIAFLGIPWSRPVPEIGLPIYTSPDRCSLGVTLGVGGLFVVVAGDGLAARALPYPLLASTQPAL